MTNDLDTLPSMCTRAGKLSVGRSTKEVREMVMELLDCDEESAWGTVRQWVEERASFAEKLIELALEGDSDD